MSRPVLTDDVIQKIRALERRGSSVYTITNADLGDSIVGSDQIVDGSVTGTDIATLTITASNIANATITATQIANATITATQIANATITATQIANATITSTQIQDLTITAGDIANTTITAGKIANNTITATQIQALTITSAEIANLTITGGKIANATITTTQIQDLTIQAGDIANNTITATQILNNTITAGQIANTTITSGQISNLTITSAQIADLTITGAKIVANTITANKIAAGTLTATEIAAGALDAFQITGANIRTSASNPKVTITSAGITSFDSLGRTSFFLDSSSGKISSLSGSQSISSINLLRNSAFEYNPAITGTGRPYSWGLYNNGLAPAPALAVIDLSGPGGTKRAARLTNSTDTTGDMGIVNPVAAWGPTVVAGRRYTLSIYGQPASSGGSFYNHVNWYDSAGAIIGGGNAGTAVTGVSNEWTRSYVTATAPAGAVRAACYAIVINPSNGFVFYFAAMQLEESEFATPYNLAPEDRVPVAGGNLLPNSRFVDWVGDSPNLWQHYDNGTNTAVWSKQAGGGPNSVDSWRLAPSAIGTIVGFMTSARVTHEPYDEVVLSFWAKGTRQPNAQISNGNTTAIWIENPTISSSVWQRYVCVQEWNASGGAAGSPLGDFLYIAYTGSAGGQLEIALPMMERGRVASPSHTPRTDELTNDVVNANVLQDNIFSTPTLANQFIGSGVINADRIVADSISAGQIAAAAIGVTELAAGSVTATKIAVGNMSDNLILNWSAEGPSTDAWGAIEGTGVTLTTVLDSTTPHGDYAFRIAAGSTGHGYRAIPVKPGSTYAVRLYLKHSNGNGTYYVRANEKTTYPAGDYVTTALRSSFVDMASAVNNSTITSWTLKEYTYTAAAGVYWMSLAVYNWGSTGNLDFDAVEMREQLPGVTIANGAITAPKISVTNLSAINADLGTITAGTVTGALIRTGSSGQRVEFNTSGVDAYNASERTFNLSSTSGGMSVISGTGGTPGAQALLNPSFATDASNWTTGAGGTATISRVTGAGTFHSGTSGGVIAGLGNGDPANYVEGAATGTYTAGHTYEIEYYAKVSPSGPFLNAGTQIRFGALGGTDYASTFVTDHSTSSFTRHTLIWTPASTVSSGVAFRHYGTTEIVNGIYIDTFTITDTTVPTDRQFRILQTVPSGAAVGAIYGWKQAENARIVLQSLPLSTEATSPSEFRTEITTRDTNAPLVNFVLSHNPNVSANKRSIAAQVQNDGGSGSIVKKLIDSAGESDWALKDNAWTTVTYGTNWRRLGNLAQWEVQVLKLGHWVMLRGIVERTTSSFGYPQTLCTLPSGFRPATEWLGLVMCQNGTGAHVLSRLDIVSGGSVIIDLGVITGLDGSNGSRVYLDGIMFSTV